MKNMMTTMTLLALFPLLQACGHFEASQAVSEMKSKSPGVSSSAVLPASLINTKWGQGCSYDNSAQAYFTQMLELYLDNGIPVYRNTIHFFSDTACTAPTVDEITRRAFVSSSGPGEVTGQLVDHKVKPRNASYVSSMNQAADCGITNWGVDIASDVTGTVCAPSTSRSFNFSLTGSSLSVNSNGQSGIFTYIP